LESRRKEMRRWLEVSHMAMNDTALLARWFTQGDAEAFKEISSKYAPMVYAACNRILRNGSEAEDVSQECFIALAAASKRKGSIRCLGAWLHAAATSRSLMKIRSEKRRSAREARFAAERRHGTETQWSDVAAYVDRAVAELPDRLRAPIILHFFEDETHDAIARELGVSRTTVTYRIQRGIDAIRKKLKRQGLLVTSAALAAMMADDLAAEAVPRTLIVALAKLALAGTGGVTATGTGTMIAYLGGGILMKKLLIGAVVLVVACFALWQIHMGKDTESPARRAPLTAGGIDEKPMNALSLKTTGTGAAGGVSGSEDKARDVVRHDAQAAPSEIRSLGSISGKVSNAETNAPLVSAFVLLSGADGTNRDRNQTRTDENGRYRFGELESGTYRVGYAVMGLLEAGNTEAQTVSLDEGEDLADVNFAAFMGLCIKGKVVDTEGRPVAKAMVMAVETPTRPPGTMVNNLSADDGTFVLHFGSRPATGYALFAGTHPMFGAQGAMLASEIQGPSYPSPDGLPEVMLVLYATAAVSGAVVNTHGEPVAEVRVIPRCVPSNEFSPMWEPGRTAQNGSFSIAGLPAGSYDLDLASPETDKFIRALPPNDRIDLARGENRSGLRLVLDLGLSIAGRVSDEAGAPIAEAHVRSADSYATTKTDGTYTLTGLTAGQYAVTVDHEEYVDASRDGVAAASSGIDFTLKRRGAIEGHVVDATTGSPIAHFEVMHFPEVYTPFYPGWEREFVDQADENGAFRIRNVRPGRATVVARAKGYLQASVEVPGVAPAETVRNVVVRLEKGLSLEGRVLDSAGKPVANAGIIPGALPSGQRLEEAIAAQTDADGTFTLTGLAADVATITAYHPGYPPTSIPVTLVPGRPNTVTFILTNGGTVEGTVYFKGDPWPARTVQLYTAAPSRMPFGTTTSESGAYRFTGVPPGDVTIAVGLEQGGGRDLLGYHSLSADAIVSEGETTEVKLNYVPGSASVEGAATVDGEPIPGGQVTLLLSTANGSEQHTRVLQQDDAGYYKFEELPAASVQLTVYANSSQESRRVEFDLQEGQSVRRDVEFSAGAAIEVNVMGLQPGERALLFAVQGEVQVDADNVNEVLHEHSGRLAGQTNVTNNGVCSLRGLTPEHYTIVALVSFPTPAGGEALRRRVRSAYVELSGESTTQVDLVLD
jgi:RNA polymerase sigma factor (sigma-70 family)